MKYAIKSSNLCLRFYLSDGWTEELLKSFIRKGELIKSHDFDNDDHVHKYYVFSMGTELDMEKLLKTYSKLIRMFDDFPKESDEEYILRML